MEVEEQDGESLEFTVDSQSIVDIAKTLAVDTKIIDLALRELAKLILKINKDERKTRKEQNLGILPQTQQVEIPPISFLLRTEAASFARFNIHYRKLTLRRFYDSPSASDYPDSRTKPELCVGKYFQSNSECPFYYSLL